MSNKKTSKTMIITSNKKNSENITIMTKEPLDSNIHISKKFDFSILNKISSLYMIFRSVAVFLVFVFPDSYRYALSIYIITWALDSFDDNVIEKTANIKLKFDDIPKMNAYSIVDKISDYFVSIVFVYWSYYYLPEFFELLFILAIYRFIGIIVYFSTMKDHYLIFFPNIVHYLLVVLIFCKVFLPKSYQAIYSQFFWFYAILISTMIVALLSELITHIIKPKIMEKY